MAAGSHARVAVYAPAAAHALAAVDTGLGDFNASESALDDVRPLHVVASDASGSTIGGAIGRTWGDCCELQQFWVAPAYRGQAIGSRLLEAFECEATLRGCSLAYLDDLLRDIRTNRSVRRWLPRMREEAVRKSSSGDLDERLQVFGDAKALALVMNVEEVTPCADLPQSR